MNLKQTAQNIETLQAIYIFFSGVLYGAILSLLTNYTYDSIEWDVNRLFIYQTAYLTVSTGIMFMGLPVLLSFASTLKHPQKRIIPPFYIQIIGVGILIADLVIHSKNYQLALMAIYASVMFTYVVGKFQDLFIVKLLGIFISPEDLKISRLKVYSDKDKISSILMGQARQSLHLEKRPLEELKKSSILKSKREARFTTYIEVDGTNNEIGYSIVNLVFFEKGDYSTLPSDDLNEYQREKTVYLQKVLIDEPNNIFSEPYGGYPKELSIRVNDDLLGVYRKTTILSFSEKIRMAVYAFVPVPIGIYAFVKGMDSTTYELIAGAIITSVTDISRILIRNRRTLNTSIQNIEADE